LYKILVTAQVALATALPYPVTRQKLKLACKAKKRKNDVKDSLEKLFEEQEEIKIA